MRLRVTRSRLLFALTALVLLTGSTLNSSVVTRPQLVDGRTVMMAGFACLVVLGLALMVLSGIGLVRRRRSD